MAEPPSQSESIEEDATELQFPKGSEVKHDTCLDIGGLLDGTKIMCGNCEISTKEPYVQCVQCQQECREMSTVICIPCFTKGAEFGSHKNNHLYTIVKNDFVLFKGGWQAREELRLVNTILECGFGNWQDVSYRMESKSAEECRKHYLKHYIDAPHPELPQLREQNLGTVIHPQPVTYEGGTDDPPRPLPGTAFCRDMAGYNAARGDFDVDYDHSAELEIQDLDYKLFEDDPKPSLGAELQMCLLDRYRRKLGERYRRKKLIRDHGLIAMSKSVVHVNRYRPYLKQLLIDAIPKFHSLLNSVEMDMLLEGLKCEAELKRHISDLLEYRHNGISKKNNIMTFETLKKRREINMKERRNLVVSQKAGVDIKWDVLTNKNVASLVSSIPCSSRRISVPLNIIGMPGYDNLSDKEKQIASEIRLVPEDFSKFKSIFIDECRRSGGLRLAQARSLLKIDVNKIRKIYDHLLSTGLIYVPKRK